MDKIFIRDLEVNTIIGVLPHERTQPQSLIISIEIFTDIRSAATSDNLKDTIDYAAIAQTITEFASTSKFQLLETLAEKIIELLFSKFPMTSLHLQITKPQAVANAKKVGISIARSRY